jgi:ubiquinone/menaquinone biosynthesis C-methylase UbiE
MSDPWNLTPTEWSKVLDTNADAQKVAERLKKGLYLPWNNVLQDCSKDSTTTLDLGSGRGENSAMLALQGKTTTLFDWAQENLDFSKRLFQALEKKATFIQGDITKPLPFSDGSFDTVFSCGVLEYFTDTQIKEILKETFRVAKKRVIILVPNAYSVCYRLGMWYMKKKNIWHWGGERAFKTLKHCFQSVPDIRIKEFSVGTKHSLDFLDSLPQGPLMHKVVRKLLNLQDHSRPSTLNQGYILITIGEKI